MKKLSVVIPTLNSSKTLPEALEAVFSQDYPRDDYEVIISDAGSKDATIEIAKSLGVDKIVSNPLKTGEAGKTAGINASSGELIALIDSDNILPDKSWIRRMVAPFDDDGIFASEPIAYSSRPTDSSLTRYFAALGMNDPLCLFVGNYDRISDVTGKWTSLKVRNEDKGDYLKLDLDGKVMPTIGANGFVFRKNILKTIKFEPYFFDIDVAQDAVRQGYGAIAKVKTSIIHLYCEKFSDFTRKQRRRIQDFLFFSKTKDRTFAWGAQKKIGLVYFILATVTVLPLVWDVIRMAFRANSRKDDLRANAKSALWWHIPVCVSTLWIYSAGVIKRILGISVPMLDRDKWQCDKIVK